MSTQYNFLYLLDQFTFYLTHKRRRRVSLAFVSFCLHYNGWSTIAGPSAAARLGELWENPLLCHLPTSCHGDHPPFSGPDALFLSESWWGLWNLLKVARLPRRPSQPPSPGSRHLPGQLFCELLSWAQVDLFLDWGWEILCSPCFLAGFLSVP